VELIHIEIHGTEKGKDDVKSMQLATTDMGSIKAREWLPVSRKEDGSLEPLRKAKKWARAGLRDLPPRLRETLEVVAERWASPAWQLDTSTGLLVSVTSSAAGASVPPSSAAAAAAPGAEAAPLAAATSGGAAFAPASAPAAAPPLAPPALADTDAEPPEAADVLVQEESSLEPAPPVAAPPQTCSWQPRGGSLCASRCRTAGCTTGACSPGHCKQLVLKRGWPACAKHPISHAEFVASGAG